MGVELVWGWSWYGGEVGMGGGVGIGMELVWG